MRNYDVDRSPDCSRAVWFGHRDDVDRKILGPGVENNRKSDTVGENIILIMHYNIYESSLPLSRHCRVPSITRAGLDAVPFEWKCDLEDVGDKLFFFYFRLQ